MTVFMAGGGGLLSFETGFAIWVLISMLVFLWGMGKFAMPHIVRALDEREQRIKNSLESAEQALAKAEEISRENKEALRKAEQEARQIRNQAIEEAEKVRNERMERAKEEAAKVLEDARNQIEQEKQRALIGLRNEVADMAVNAASRILDSELDKDKNRKLVDRFIDDLSKN